MSGVKLRLLCLVWPYDKPVDHIVEVEVDNDRTVAALRDIIKAKYASRLDKVAAHNLVLWKCSIPVDNNLQETLNAVHFNVADPRLHRLSPPFEISELFEPVLPRKTIHVLIEVPALDTHLELAEVGDIIGELPENMRFLKIVSHPGKPPSTAAKSSEYPKTQAKEEFAIHDGLYSNAPNSRPLTTVAPPIQIFHPIFEQFISDGNDPHLDLPREFLIKVRDFMSFTSQLKTSEQSSNPQLLRWLSGLSEVAIREVANADMTRPDSMSMFDIPGLNESAPLLVAELKRILGEGGCDPSIQAGCSMRRTWIQDDRTKIRDRCCCPTFLVAGGGPWICILGAVFTDKVIVQRLTEMMWIGLSSTSEEDRIHRFARVMMALRKNLAKLSDYYENISNTNPPPFRKGYPHARFYPYPTSFIENGKLISFDYMKMLEDDPTCVTYLAKIQRGDESPGTDEFVVIKFVDRYGGKVHQFLADKGDSPKLRYYGPLEVGDSPGNSSLPAPPTAASPSYLLSSPMKMVVMDYVKPHRRPADAQAQLEKILMDLHAEGYVFGDLREPNILFNEGGKVQLIDLNWAGRYDMALQDTSLPRDLQQKILNSIERVQGSVPTEFVKYPLNMSASISWAQGALALLPILPQHDWEMLGKLEWA